jgi:hypothetical protein
MNRKQTIKPGSGKRISAPYSSVPSFIKIEGMRDARLRARFMAADAQVWVGR